MSSTPQGAWPSTEQYEQLRAAALGESSATASRFGLALCLHKGLPAWLAAWTACAPAEAKRFGPPAPLPPLDEMRRQTVELLCAMTAGHLGVKQKNKSNP